MNKKYFHSIVLIVLSVLVVIFILENLGRIEVRFLSFHLRIPGIVVIIGSALLGIAIEKIIGVYRKRQ
jgi:uncharacterized integral membrane protein